MEHFGKFVSSVVAHPVGDCVIGAHVAVQPHVLPLIVDGPVPVPRFPRCCDHHVIRTKTHVAIIKVRAEITAYPRVISHGEVEKCAGTCLLEALEAENVTPTPEAYAHGLRNATQRLVDQMRGFGVKIT